MSAAMILSGAIQQSFGDYRSLKLQEPSFHENQRAAYIADIKANQLKINHQPLIHHLQERWAITAPLHQ